MRLVEFVLSEDAMEDPIAVVHVHDAFQEVLNGRDDGHVGGEEKGAVGQHGTEATHYEEEELNDGQQDRPVNEFIEDHS